MHLHTLYKLLTGEVRFGTTEAAAWVAFQALSKSWAGGQRGLGWSIREDCLYSSHGQTSGM